jgi:hypothetical protein
VRAPKLWRPPAMQRAFSRTRYGAALQCRAQRYAVWWGLSLKNWQTRPPASGVAWVQSLADRQPLLQRLSA